MITLIAILTNTTANSSYSAKYLSNTYTETDSLTSRRHSKRTLSVEDSDIIQSIHGANKNANNSWWDKATSTIQQHRYRFVLQATDSATDLEKVWIGNNSAQKLVTSFSPSGVTIKPLNTTDQAKNSWQLNMHFISAGEVGSNLNLRQVSDAIPKVETNKLSYHRGDITEWYVNKPQGIEQGFTIHQPLNQKNTDIEIRLRIDGYQQINYNSDGSIVFSVDDQEEVLHYGLPHAFDAKNTPLPVKMSLRDKQLSLVVQTQNATYPITIDPLIGTATDNCNDPYLWCDGVSFESSDYGYTTINAGDVNGDGFDDILITDPFYNYTGVQFQQGEAYLFYGSALGLTHTIQWSQLGSVASSSFGLSAASGDINGDGFSDVIIGAPGDLSQVAATYLGQVFVYYGSATGLAASADWTATSAFTAERFGDAVAAADVNGDGLDAVIIGAPGHTTIDAQQVSYANAGAVYVYYATAAGLPTTANWQVEAYQADALLGDAVANAGNVNGDINSINAVEYHVQDLIIGAYHFDTTDAQNIVHPNAGRAIVYYGAGNAGLPRTAANGAFSIAPDWMQESFTDYMFFGEAVASAGNVNGDKTTLGIALDDVIIAAPAFRNSVNSPSPPYPGQAYVFHGSTNGLGTTKTWTASGSNYGLFGQVVASAGDINEDGYSDVLVGEPYYNSTTANESGRALIYYGSGTGVAAQGELIGTGAVSGDNYGWSLDSADVNNDGYGDIVVGARSLHSYPADPTLILGGVYLFEGAGDSDLAISMMNVNTPNGVEYSITITNNGPDAAHKLRFTDTWPVGGTVNYVSSGTPPLWNCTADLAASKLNCPAAGDTATNIRLASGKTVLLTIILQDVSLSGIRHTAEVTANIIDPILTNNSVTSTPINFPPQGTDLAFTITEDITATNLSFGVVDPDPNSVISYVIVTPPGNGTLTINKDAISGNDTGTFDYQPSLNNNLPDSFIFEAFDEKGASSGPLAVAITMTPVNDAPVAAQGLSFTLVKTPTVFTLTDLVTAKDVDSVQNSLVFSAVPTIPTNGTLGTLAMDVTGLFTYDASNVTVGTTEQFGYSVTDGGLSDSATISITVIVGAAANAPPTITPNQQLSVTEDVLASGVFGATDLTPTPVVLTYTLDPNALASRGVVTITNAVTGAFSYQPTNNSFGPDRIGFIVTDNGTPPLEATGSVAVTIAPVNDPPSALPVSIAVNQNSLFSDNVAVPLKGSDIDPSDTLSYSIATAGAEAPQKGSINWANNNTAIIYQPNAGSAGVDTFVYTVTDNGSPPASTSSAVTVTINAAPIINAAADTTVSEDGSVTISIDVSDSDSAIVSLSLDSAFYSQQPVQELPIIAEPILGAIAATRFIFTYTPKANFNGTDTLSFTVSDDTQPTPLSTTGSLQITVTAQNDNPQALATPVAGNPITINEDSAAITFTLLATDIDLDPSLNMAGITDSLTFSIDDIDLIPNSDGTIDTNLGKLVLIANSGSVTYTPNPNSNGTDIFAFKVSDSAPSPVISSANVTIEITAQNDAPVFNAPSGVISVFQDQMNKIDLSAYVSDVDSTDANPTIFIYSLLDGATSITTANGASVTVTANNSGIYNYQAPVDYVDIDSFDVQVSDNFLTAKATIRVNVAASNGDSPLATDFPGLETDEDVPYEGTLIATAPNGRVITQYVITGTPSTGSVTMVDSVTGEFKYDPQSNFNGVDSFEYAAVDDTDAQSAAAKVSLKINPINDAPSIDELSSDLYVEVAAADQVVLNGKTIKVTDIDSTQLLYSISRQPRNGTVTITPDQNDPYLAKYDYVGNNRLHEGEDSFVVTVADDSNGSIEQQVTICTYIDNAICDTLTKPDLVSPPHGAVDVATTSDFEWQQSRLKNNKTGDISYRVIVCKSSEFIDCAFISIPKDVVDKANNKQASALGIGGTTVLIFGLIGGLSQRRQRKLRNIIIAAVILLSACNSAVEEAAPGPTPVNKSGNIVFSVPNLDANTSYFWKVVSTDETTQKSAQSVTQKFITAP